MYEIKNIKSIKKSFNKDFSLNFDKIINYFSRLNGPKID